MTINAPAAVLLAMYNRGGGKTGGRSQTAERHHPERYLKGVFVSRHLYLSPQAFHADHHGHLLLLRRTCAPLEHHQHQRVSYSGGRFNGGAGNRLSPWPTASPMWTLPSKPDWMWTSSAPDSPSFSTPTWISWKKWPNTGQPGSCGPIS